VSNDNNQRLDVSHSLAGFYQTDIAHFCAALRALDAPQSDATSRVVTSAEIHWRPQDPPAPHGLWSPQLFGEHGDRWAVIELALPIVFQRTIDLIGELLEISADRLRAIVFEDHSLTARNLRDLLGPSIIDAKLIRKKYPFHHRAGFSLVQAALEQRADLCLKRYGLRPDQLFIDRIPVPPLEARASTRFAGVRRPGPINQTLASLIRRNTLAKRLLELNSPQIFLLNERRLLGELVSEAAALLEGEDPCGPSVSDLLQSGFSLQQPRSDHCELFVGKKPQLALRFLPQELDETIELLGSCNAVVLRRSHAILDFPSASLLFDIASGEIKNVWPSPYLTLKTTTKSGLLWYLDGASWQPYFYDLEKNDWVRGAIPDEVRVAFFEADEAAYLVDRSLRAKPLREVTDYPSVVAIAPGGEFIFVADSEGAGGAYCRNGELQLPCFELGPSLKSPYLLSDGSFVSELPAALEDELEQDPGLAVALVHAGDVWRSIHASILFNGVDDQFQFSFPVDAACFSEDGDAALVASRDQLFLIDVSQSPRIRKRWDLRPLRALFVPSTSRDRDMEPRALIAALTAHGSLRGVRDATVDELAALNCSEPHDAPSPLGESRAQKLKALVDGVNVERLFAHGD
jgi:hypothetical protein